MIDENDRGWALAAAVAERVTAKYPAISVEIRDGGGFVGTAATFTPRNPDGAPITLYATYDWSFDLHVGRFILVESEPMEGNEAERVDLIVEAILKVAREGISRSFLDRLIPSGRDRVGPWDK